MDQLSMARSVLDVKWDLPFRLAASLAGVAALAGLLLGVSPLRTVAGALKWAGVASATWVTDLEAWLEARPIVLIAPGLLLLLAGVIFSYRRGLAGAAAVVGAAALVQAGGLLLIAPAIAFGLLGVTWLMLRIFAARVFGVLEDPTHYLASAIGTIVGALFWAVLGPVAWVTRRG